VFKFKLATSLCTSKFPIKIKPFAHLQIRLNCFINGKVDFENYLIKKPWGTYKKGDPAVSSTWDMIKFDIEESISGIKIQM